MSPSVDVVPDDFAPFQDRLEFPDLDAAGFSSGAASPPPDALGGSISEQGAIGLSQQDGQVSGSPASNTSAPSSQESSPSVSADDRERQRLLEEAQSSPGLIPASRETPQVRLAYLQSVLGNIVDQQTVLASQRVLRTVLDVVELAGILPELPRPARTLRTAARRLGLLIDDFVTQLPVCTHCWKPYTAEAFEALTEPGCIVPNCPGIVYSRNLKRRCDEDQDYPSGNSDDTTQDGSTHAGPGRRPAKIQPWYSLVTGLRRYLLRPDFVDNLIDMSEYTEQRRLSPDTTMNDIHDGIHFGQLPMGLERVVEADGRVLDIEVTPGSRSILAKCDVGMSMTLSIDWFGIISGRHHSAGGVYVIFNNLRRAVRFLTHNVHQVTLISGPKEPSLEQLNNALLPLKWDLDQLYKGADIIWKRLCADIEDRISSPGIIMIMYKREIPPRVQGGIELHVSDIEALRKVIGAAGHAHKKHPCNVCLIDHDDINALAGYAIANFHIRDDWQQLCWGFMSKSATSKTARKHILDEGGSRHTILNELPGWMPIQTNAIDFMHNIYLGIVKHEFDTVIIGGYLLDAASWRLFQDLVNSIQWPSGIGRLPKNLGENHSLQKADQWRCWCNIKPTILWLIWRDDNDKICSNAPLIPAQSNSPPTFRRSLREIYKCTLYSSTAERLLARKSITLEHVRRGQRYLRKYCVGLLELGVHLVINHHMAMHYEFVFPRFGPTYGWWLFGFERCNGDQEKVNHNGHDGGEMELTLMRNWVGRHRLHELLVSSPGTFTPKERALLDHYLQPKGANRGTLRQQLASFDTEHLILIPQRKSVEIKYTNLRTLITPQVNPYRLVLAYLQCLWPEQSLVDDLTLQPGAIPLVASRCAVGLPFVYKDGLRFGSLLDNRSTKDRFALVNFPEAQVPCKLLYHLQIVVKGKPEELCSIVRRMRADPMLPTMPWDLYAPDLGVYVVEQDKYGAAEIVPTSTLAAAVALIPVRLNNLAHDRPLWVVHSFDRSGIEPADDWIETAVQELLGEPGEGTGEDV
ncbi:hypothetical protein ACG7TL_003069 [Trametes sanguinea]